MQADISFGPVRIYFGAKRGKYPDGNQVIVQGADRRAVFDSPQIANYIGKDFDDADLVIQGHVHEDHIAGLHRIPNVPVYVHELDLPSVHSWPGLCDALGYAPEVCEMLRPQFERDFCYVPRSDALSYVDGESWDLGDVTVKAIHLPGHTAGHCGLLVEEAGLLFIGDIDLSGFGPVYGNRSSSLADFRRSLSQLIELPAEIWVTSHHRGIYSDREKFLHDLSVFENKFDVRRERLLNALREKPRSLDEMVAQGFLFESSAVPVWSRDTDRWTLIHHLDELQSQGLAFKREDGLFEVNL
jgi:glyoxylase-like metal-dependent hydrolase (beta-lactamase superfamily II)